MGGLFGRVTVGKRVGASKIIALPALLVAISSSGPHQINSAVGALLCIIILPFIETKNPA